MAVMEQHRMSREEAEAFMDNHDAYDPVHCHELMSVFCGLFGREADVQEQHNLWVLCSTELDLDPWRKSERR